jgi:hypothetical protein
MPLQPSATTASPTTDSAPGSGTGVNKNPWISLPVYPYPVICPASFIPRPMANLQPESGSMSVFKSTIPRSLVYRNAVEAASPGVEDSPVTWPLSLMA